MSINIEINHQLLLNIDDKVYISGQISTDMIEDLNKKCFGLIVNNRPDNEEINQFYLLSMNSILIFMSFPN